MSHEPSGSGWFVDYVGHLSWILPLIGLEAARERHFRAAAYFVVAGLAVAFATYQIPKLVSAWKERRGNRDSVLIPTTKGFAELLLQEQRAWIDLPATYKAVDSAMNDLSKPLARLDGGLKDTATVALTGDVAKTLAVHHSAWRTHAAETKAKLSDVEERIGAFERAVDGMLECWFVFAKVAKRDREHAKRFRAWAEVCAGQLPTTSDDVFRVIGKMESELRGQTQDGDQVLNALVLLLRRFADTLQRLRLGAGEMLVVLDKSVSWPERMRWRAERKRLREKRSFRPPSVTQAP